MNIYALDPPKFDQNNFTQDAVCALVSTVDLDLHRFLKKLCKIYPKQIFI